MMFAKLFKKKPELSIKVIPKVREDLSLSYAIEMWQWEYGYKVWRTKCEVGTLEEVIPIVNHLRQEPILVYKQ